MYLIQELSKALRDVAVEVADDVKSQAPVLTGRLRDSVEVRVKRKQAIIEVDAPYADEVEYGTRHNRAQPFFFKNVRKIASKLTNRLLTSLNK